MRNVENRLHDISPPTHPFLYKQFQTARNRHKNTLCLFLTKTTELKNISGERTIYVYVMKLSKVFLLFFKFFAF